MAHKPERNSQGNKAEEDTEAAQGMPNVPAGEPGSREPNSEIRKDEDSQMEWQPPVGSLPENLDVASADSKDDQVSEEWRPPVGVLPDALSILSRHQNEERTKDEVAPSEWRSPEEVASDAFLAALEASKPGVSSRESKHPPQSLSDDIANRVEVFAESSEVHDDVAREMQSSSEHDLIDEISPADSNEVYDSQHEMSVKVESASEKLNIESDYRMDEESNLDASAEEQHPAVEAVNTDSTNISGLPAQTGPRDAEEEKRQPGDSVPNELSPVPQDAELVGSTDKVSAKSWEPPVGVLPDNLAIISEPSKAESMNAERSQDEWRPPVGALPDELPIVPANAAEGARSDRTEEEVNPPVGVLPDDLPVLASSSAKTEPGTIQTAATRGRQTSSQMASGTISQIDRWLIGIAFGAFMTLLAILGVSRAVAEFYSLAAEFPLTGWVYLVVLLAAVICVATLAVRVWLRYHRLQEVVQLRSAIECYLSDPIYFSDDRWLRQEWQNYLTRLELTGDPQTLKHIGYVRSSFNNYLNDPARDLEEIETLLLASLDQRADAITEKRAAQVAVSTALASRLLDGIIVFWQSVRLVDDISQLYAGRPGLLGTFQILTRSVAMLTFAELTNVATEAVGGIFAQKASAKLGARVAEGAANGLLMIRLGEAIKRQCRPAPIRTPLKHPVTRLASVLHKSLGFEWLASFLSSGAKRA